MPGIESFRSFFYSETFTLQSRKKLWEITSPASVKVSIQRSKISFQRTKAYFERWCLNVGPRWTQRGMSHLRHRRRFANRIAAIECWAFYVIKISFRRELTAIPNHSAGARDVLH